MTALLGGAFMRLDRRHPFLKFRFKELAILRCYH